MNCNYKAAIVFLIDYLSRSLLKIAWTWLKKEAGQGKRDLSYALQPRTWNNPEQYGTIQNMHETVWKTTDAVHAIPECSVLYWTSTAVVKAYTKSFK